jgi:hypothetical protein
VLGEDSLGKLPDSCVVGRTSSFMWGGKKRGGDAGAGSGEERGESSLPPASAECVRGFSSLTVLLASPESIFRFLMGAVVNLGVTVEADELQQAEGRRAVGEERGG